MNDGQECPSYRCLRFAILGPQRIIAAGRTTRVVAPMAVPSPKMCWVGFDLGGTKMLSAAFDSEFEPLARRRRKTKGFEGAKAGVDRIIETIRQTLEESLIDATQLSGIGLGCPGSIDLDSGTLLEAANLGWKGREAPRNSAKRFWLPCGHHQRCRCRRVWRISLWRCEEGSLRGGSISWHGHWGWLRV